MNVTHYGVPVHITTPAPSDTISYQQFMKMLGQYFSRIS